MAVYKVPEVRIIDALPMTATGKVKKQDHRTCRPAPAAAGMETLHVVQESS